MLYSSSLGVVDFHPSGDCAVIFLSAAEVIEGQLFKRRLAVLRSVSLLDDIIDIPGNSKFELFRLKEFGKLW